MRSPNDGSGSINTTPLTSLVSAYLTKDPDTSVTLADIDQALQTIANRLSIDEKKDILKNHLSLSDREILSLNLQIQKALESFKSADESLKDTTIYEAFAVGLDSIQSNDGFERVIENLPKSKLGSDGYKVKDLAKTMVTNVQKTFENSTTQEIQYIVNVLRVQQRQIVDETQELFFNVNTN